MTRKPFATLALITPSTRRVTKAQEVVECSNMDGTQWVALKDMIPA
jgi:hypothetical protein